MAINSSSPTNTFLWSQIFNTIAKAWNIPDKKSLSSNVNNMTIKEAINDMSIAELDDLDDTIKNKIDVINDIINHEFTPSNSLLIS